MDDLEDAIDAPFKVDYSLLLMTYSILGITSRNDLELLLTFRCELFGGIVHGFSN